MKLKEIFNQLTFGEFSQLNLGGAASGGITEENYAAVVAHINMGVTALHTRFLLREGAADLSLVSGQVDYLLPEDCLKLLEVVAPSGIPLPLNNRGAVLSCMTPSASLLRVPAAVVEKLDSLPDYFKTDILQLRYQQAPLPLAVDDFGIDPETVDVELPYTHLQALLMFIAARLYSLGEISGQPLAYNAYYARYEAECAQLIQAGMSVSQQAQFNRLRACGWV